MTDLSTGEIIEKPLIVGEKFNIRIGKGKFCIGTDVEKGWVSCIQNTGSEKPNIVIKGRQCSTCRTVDMFACRKTCVGSVCLPSSPLVKQMCEPAETTVYLTEVGGVNKVGVSLSYLRRWIEQGSDFGYRLASLPGLEARAVEQIISRDLEIRQQVGIKRKYEKINAGNKEFFEMKLGEILPSIKAIFDEVKMKSGVEGTFYMNNKIIDLNPYYGNLAEVDRLQVFDIKEGAEFGGEILGIKGSIIVVKSGRYFFGVSISKLAGYEIEFLDVAKNKGQSSLDEWF